MFRLYRRTQTPCHVNVSNCYLKLKLDETQPRRAHTFSTCMHSFHWWIGLVSLWRHHNGVYRVGNNSETLHPGNCCHDRGWLWLVILRRRAHKLTSFRECLLDICLAIRNKRSAQVDPSEPECASPCWFTRRHWRLVWLRCSTTIPFNFEIALISPFHWAFSRVIPAPTYVYLGHTFGATIDIMNGGHCRRYFMCTQLDWPVCGRSILVFYFRLRRSSIANS